MHKKLGVAAGIAGSLFAAQHADAATSYVIKSGDTLSQIAQAHHVELSSLINSNPQIKNPNLVYPGDKVILPKEEKSIQGSQTDAVLQNEESKNIVTSNVEKEDSRMDVTSKNIKEDLIKSAEQYLGTPFRYGASMNRTDRFDCSSFTKRVFQENGYDIPRVSRHQAKAGKRVRLKNAEIGDLVFFDTNFNGVINHVGIYAGDSRMIHVSSSRGVRYANLSSTYWKKRYVKTVRII